MYRILKGGAYRIFVGKPEGRRSLGRHIGINGRIILKLIFKKLHRGHGLD